MGCCILRAGALGISGGPLTIVATCLKALKDSMEHVHQHENKRQVFKLNIFCIDLKGSYLPSASIGQNASQNINQKVLPTCGSTSMVRRAAVTPEVE